MRHNRGIVNGSTMNVIGTHISCFDSILKENRNPLLHEAIQFCQLVGVPIVNKTLVQSVEEIDKTQFHFPVVAKLVSPNAIHKTEVEGVTLNINDKKQLKEVFEHMRKSLYEYNPNAAFSSVYVHTMAPKGAEFFIGAKKDPVFGPIVLVGLGGIYAELFKDVAFRLAPVSRVEALEMIHQLKAVRLFEGFRGKEPLDANALVEFIVTVSHAIASIDKISDIECNPVMVYPLGCMAVDARIFLQKQEVASPMSL